MHHDVRHHERDVSALQGNAALGRLVEPAEIARAVAFLASPDAAAITGVNLPVDCGWLVAGSWHTYGGLRQAASSVGAEKPVTSPAL
jgi:NAD(P)-dependent dehydrogenase (short-subunit alcohol dehydrogenase family)